MNAFEKGLKDRVANGAEADWVCHICGADQKEAVRMGGDLKTDGESRVWCPDCIRRSLKTKTVVHTEKLPGRNEPCYCGSGKKFKHCHARKGG